MADRIRKINSQTGDVHAVITTDGSKLPATASIFGLAVSNNGTVYASDYFNHVVYKVFEDGRVSGAIVGKIATPGDVTTPVTPPSMPQVVGEGQLAAGGRNISRLNRPLGICVDAGDNIYISDSVNNKVKRLSPSGRCQTLAGGGPAAGGDAVNDNGLLAKFDLPSGICVDKAGVVYVCDTVNNKIKKILPSGKVVVLAGAGDGLAGMANGNGNAAKFNNPSGICVESNGTLYVADTGNYRIRKIDPSGNVTTLAGFSNGSADGVGNLARFGSCFDICVDNSGTIFVLDWGNNTIRRVTTAGKVTTLMGYKDGTTGDASSIAVDKSGFLYFLEKNI